MTLDDFKPLVKNIRKRTLLLSLNLDINHYLQRMIDSKEKIINYFKSGIKEPKISKLGSSMKSFYLIIWTIEGLIFKIKKCLQPCLNLAGIRFLKKNIIALNKGGKNITLNQVIKLNYQEIN